MGRGRGRRGSGRRGRREPDLEAGPGHYHDGGDSGCDTTTILLTVLLGLLIIVGGAAFLFREKLFGNQSRESTKKDAPKKTWLRPFGGKTQEDAQDGSGGTAAKSGSWKPWIITGGLTLLGGVAYAAYNWKDLGPKFWKFWYTRGGTKKLSGEGLFLANQGICSDLKGDWKADEAYKTCKKNWKKCDTDFRKNFSGKSEEEFNDNDKKLRSCVNDIKTFHSKQLSNLNERIRNAGVQNKKFREQMEGKGESYRLKDRSLKPMIDEMCKLNPGAMDLKNARDHVPAPFIGNQKKFERSIKKHIKDVEAAKNNVSESFLDFIPDILKPSTWGWVKSIRKSVNPFHQKTEFIKDFKQVLQECDNVTGDHKKAAILQKFAAKNRGTSWANMHSFHIPKLSQASYNATLWNKLRVADDKANPNKGKNIHDNFVTSFRPEEGENGECIDPDLIDPKYNKTLWKKARLDKNLWRSHYPNEFYEKNPECLDDIQENGRATAMVNAANQYAAELGIHKAAATPDAEILDKYRQDLTDCAGRWNYSKFFEKPKAK